jgi:hypothetical protein
VLWLVCCRLKTSGKWEAHHWQWDKQADHKPTERTKWIKRKQVGAGLLAAF